MFHIQIYFKTLGQRKANWNKRKSEEEQGKELSNPIVSFKVYSILQRNAGANLLAGQVQFNYGIVSSTSALLKKVTGKIVKLQKDKAILVYK